MNKEVSFELKFLDLISVYWRCPSFLLWNQKTLTFQLATAGFLLFSLQQIWDSGLHIPSSYLTSDFTENEPQWIMIPLPTGLKNIDAPCRLLLLLLSIVVTFGIQSSVLTQDLQVLCLQFRLLHVIQLPWTHSSTGPLDPSFGLAFPMDCHLNLTFSAR